MENFFKQYDIDVPDLYEQENNDNPVAYAHFKARGLDGDIWDWYVTEARPQGADDMLMFGLVNGAEKELGYFTLYQLASVGAVIDLSFEPVGVYDIFDDFDLRGV